MTRKHIGILAAVLLILGASGYIGLKYYIENDARIRLQQWVNQTGRISALSYQSLEIGLFSKTVQINQVSLQIKDIASPIAIDRLVLHSFEANYEIPTAMRVELLGIHISRSNSFMKGVSSVLADLGYADIKADLEYDYRYDPLKKDLEIQQIRILVSDMGQLEMTAQLNNLDMAAVKSFPNNPLALIALVPSVAISRITLNYQDHSLTRRIIQMGAWQSGQSKEEFTSGLIQHLSLEIEKQKLPAARNVLLAVQRFIIKPGSIEVALSPRHPVSLMHFVMGDDIDQLFDMLNISVYYKDVNQNT